MRGDVVSIVTGRTRVARGPIDGMNTTVDWYACGTSSGEVNSYTPAAATKRSSPGKVMVIRLKYVMIRPGPLTVTSNVGVVSLVRLSVDDWPVSLAACRSSVKAADPRSTRVVAMKSPPA